MGSEVHTKEWGIHGLGYTQSVVHTKWELRYTRKSGVLMDWHIHGVGYTRSEVYTKWGVRDTRSEE